MMIKAPSAREAASAGQIENDDAPNPRRRGGTSEAGLSERGVCDGRQ
jgi:hypothetical protein